MEIMSKSWAFKGLVIVVLAAAVGGESNLLPQVRSRRQRRCTYAVTIETTRSKDAATSDHISLRFGDARSNDVLARSLNTKRPRRIYPLKPSSIPLDNVLTTPFQPCTTDECVESWVCYLYLRLEGKDDWGPGVAHVRGVGAETSGRSSGYFCFRRYMPRKVWYGVDACDDAVDTPFGVKHKRKVLAQKHHISR